MLTVKTINPIPLIRRSEAETDQPRLPSRPPAIHSLPAMSVGYPSLPQNPLPTEGGVVYAPDAAQSPILGGRGGDGSARQEIPFRYGTVLSRSGLVWRRGEAGLV